MSRGASRVIVFLGCLLSAPCSHAQSPGTPAVPAQFEVAAVKTNPTCVRTSLPAAQSHGRFNIDCTTLDLLIRASYVTYADDSTLNLHAQSVGIEGGPAWVRSEYFAVNAKAAGDAPLRQIMGPMMRALLEDRFKLRIHRAEKTVPIYQLTVSKSGPKLQRAREGECIRVVDANAPPDFSLTPKQRPLCGMRIQLGSIEVHGMNMSLFAARLGLRMDRDVFDATGLEGAFDFRLDFSSDSATPGFPGAFRRRDSAIASPDSPTPTEQSTGPSIFNALEEQLGLKLQPAKGTAEDLVIDRIEKPSKN